MYFILLESVTLITTSAAEELPRSKKSSYNLKLEGRNIKWVRVLLSNGDIVFNSYDNHLAKDCKINIWVDGSEQPQIAIRNAGKYLELVSDKKFKLGDGKHSSQIYDQSGGRSVISYFKRTYATDNPITRLQILNKNNQVVFEFNEPPAGDDAFIKWILIWPDKYRYNLK